MEGRVSVEQAAKELKMGIGTVRALMKYDKLKIGYAIKRDGASKWSYFIFRSLLDEEKKRLKL